MNFEDILNDIGSFCKFQKILILSTLPCFIVLPWLCMNTTFMSVTPDHWCYVPEVENSNLSLDLKMQLIRPPNDPFCSMYDVNYSHILRSGNWNVDKTWPTKACPNGYKFDHSNYDATASTRWNMVCGNAHYSSLLVSSTFIGHVIGTPFYGYMADRFGRKPTFIMLVSLLTATNIGSVLSPYFELFLCVRALYGTALSTLYGVTYFMVLELVSPDMRAKVNGLASTTWSAGLCFLPLVVWLSRTWITLSIVTTTASASLLLLSILLPESPSWLISQEKYEDATKILKKIGKMNGRTKHEMSQLHLKIQILGDKIRNEKKDQAKYSPIYFIRYPKLRKRFFIIMICWVGNCVPYYGLQMNVENLSGNDFLNFFYVSLIEIPAHLAAWILMDYIGRRWCSISSFGMSAVSCLLPVLIPLEDGLVGVISSICAKAGTSAAFMTLYQQGPELFPTPLRATGMSMAGTVGVGSALLSPYITFMSKYHKNIPFLVFAIISLISGMCAFLLPETLNKELPQTIEDVEKLQDPYNFFSWTRKFRRKQKLRENIQMLKISPLMGEDDISMCDLQVAKGSLSTAEQNECITKFETLSASTILTKYVVK